MKRTITRTLSGILLFSYTFVAAAGNTVLLRELFGSGDHDHHITGGRSSQPIPGSPEWTVKSSVQQSVPSEQSVHTGPVEMLLDTDQLHHSYISPGFRSKYTYLESLPSKPRDPPLA